MAISRKIINDRIEAYAKAVRNRSAKDVSLLFAEKIDHIVHGIGTDPQNPWNTKKESDREGIRKIYEDFFANIEEIKISYTDRIIDIESNSAAFVVRVENKTVHMENALQIKWNENGEIVYFYNWYGETH
ncbi:MAG: hypothetical protein GQ527_10975 [Bacteroidales bacterium]|nr:hypothetical protein [Bacteroidales bacterium]